MAGKTLEEAHTAQCDAWWNGCNGNSTSQQMSSASTNMVTTSGAPQETTVTINGQSFILTPAASTVPTSVNTVIAHSDTVFSSNLSDYDTDASSFSL